MKKTIITALLSIGFSAAADAADITYTGANNGAWATAANWSTGTVPTSGDQAIIGSEESAVIVNYTGTTETLTGVQVNIAEGSTLKAAAQLWGATLNFDHANAVVYTSFNNTANKTVTTFNMGQNGSVYFNTTARALEKAVYTFNGSIAVRGIEAAGDYYTVMSRTLVHFDGINGFNAAGSYDYLAHMTASFTSSLDDSITMKNIGNAVANSAAMTASADTLGNYRLQLVKAEGGSVNLVVQYVTAVPEPATATLSLLALAGLAARRRRK